MAERCVGCNKTLREFNKSGLCSSCSGQEHALNLYYQIKRDNKA